MTTPLTRLGPGGRRFKSCLPDFTKVLEIRGFWRSRRGGLAGRWVQLGSNFCSRRLQGMKRRYGSGQLYVKSGAYYVRWRTADGRRANRRLGRVRTLGESDGLTRAQAERAAQALIARDGLRSPPVANHASVDGGRGGLRVAGASGPRGRRVVVSPQHAALPTAHRLKQPIQRLALDAPAVQHPRTPLGDHAAPTVPAAQPCRRPCREAPSSDRRAWRWRRYSRRGIGVSRARSARRSSTIS